ncbi:MAG: hypothetical protein ACYC4N_11395 [Pirellulaceae bacterium]
MIGISVVLSLLVSGLCWADSRDATTTNCTETETRGSTQCCAHCGSRRSCEKYSKIVCEMKEVKKTVWVVKCEEICTILPSCPLSGPCDCGSGQCAACNPSATCAACEAQGGKCDPCASLENRNFNTPKCGRVREKKTLEKKEITCHVPTYKCVVVYSCPQCGQQDSRGEEPSPAAAPVKSALLPPAPGPSHTLLDSPLPSTARSTEVHSVPVLSFR